MLHTITVILIYLAQALEPVLAPAACSGILALSGVAATYVVKRWKADALAAAIKTAGSIAYDALAAATRTPGVPDYAAARSIALAEGKASLLAALPKLTDAAANSHAVAALGSALIADPAFSATVSQVSGMVPGLAAAAPMLANIAGDATAVFVGDILKKQVPDGLPALPSSP